jgi:hypothetical protein
MLADRSLSPVCLHAISIEDLATWCCAAGSTPERLSEPGVGSLDPRVRPSMENGASRCNPHRFGEFAVAGQHRIRVLAKPAAALTSHPAAPEACARARLRSIVVS